MTPILFTKARQKRVLNAFGLFECYPGYMHLKKFYSPREILQYVGTTFLRGFDDGIHLINLPLDTSKWNIETDARFDNEISYLHARSASSCFSYLALYVHR